MISPPLVRLALQVVAGIGLLLLSLRGTALDSKELQQQNVLSADCRPAVSQLIESMSQTDGLLIGQNCGHANYDIQDGYARTMVRLEEETGRRAAILALDYGYGTIPDSFDSANAIARRFAKSGGIVSISMHPPNPWTSGGANDLNVGDFDDLFRRGTIANRRWRGDLDRVAQGLTELRDAGVIVLWRPLHEMNGGWFWWCPENNGRWLARRQFARLWKDMHRYFTVEKQLNNLVWVYSAAVRTERHHQPSDFYYPGDEFVDVVGLDWYTDDLTNLDVYGSYTRLQRLGKPMGLTEFGPLKQRDGSFNNLNVLDIARDYSELRFVTFWHSWPDNKMAIVDQRNAGRLLRHGNVKDLSRFANRP